MSRKRTSNAKPRRSRRATGGARIFKFKVNGRNVGEPSDGPTEWCSAFGIPGSLPFPAAPVSHHHDRPQDPKAPHWRALEQLAKDIDNRREFLALAKAAWDSAHVGTTPTRGKPSVADQCFDAMREGLEKLGLSYWPKWALMSDLEMLDGIPDDPTYQQLPQGRLVQMIRDRYPAIKPSTARKYARIYDRESFPVSSEPNRRRVLGMTLLQKAKKAMPALYKTKPRTRP